MKLGHRSGLRPILLPIVLGALAWPGHGVASVLDWLNDQVGRVLNEQDSAKGPKKYDEALKFLDEMPAASPPRPSEPPAANPPPTGTGPAPSPSSGVRLAFRDILPLDVGSASLRQFGTQTYELGSWSLTQGFILPERVADLLEEGISPSHALVEAFIQTLTTDPNGTTLLRAQTAMERMMLQIQSSHQLVVEARSVLSSAQDALGAVDRELEPIMTREGQIAALPGMIAMTQIIQKGSGNQKSGLRQLESLLVFFRKAFQAATAEVGHLEQLSHQLAYLTRDRIRLGDRKADLQQLLGSLFTIRDSLGNILGGIRTSRELVRINKQSLMHLLVTMDKPRAMPGEGTIVLRPGSQGPVPGSLTRVNQTLLELNRKSGPVLMEQQIALKRVARWTRELKDFKASPIELEALPNWVFTESTLPRSGSRTAKYRLLPEDEKDLTSVLDVLEQDVDQDDPSLRSRQLELDAALGDQPAAPASRSPRHTGTIPTSESQLPRWY